MSSKETKKPVHKGFDSATLIADVAKLEAQRQGSPQEGQNGRSVPPETQKPSEPKKSLRDLLRETVNKQEVKELSEELGQAQFKPEDIQQYVGLRWEINRLPGMVDGWASKTWEDQVKVLGPMTKRSPGMKMMVSTIEQLHSNTFLVTTLEGVMKHFGIPLQNVKTLLQLKNFLDEAVKADLLVVEENPKHQSEGITILADLGDHTNHAERTYSPRKGSKVAHDAWVIVTEKYDEALEAWQDFEKLRKLARPWLTPFKASDKEGRDGKNSRRGQSGELFVMPASADWAVLLNVHDGKDDRKVATIIKYVGLEEKDLPTPNIIDWNHKGHCLYGSERSDVWDRINTELLELNSRQRERGQAEMERNKVARDKLDKLATMPSEPRDQGLHRILDNEAGTVSIFLPNFTFRKKNGKIKTGHFGVAIKCDDDRMPVLVGVETSECFCFHREMLGKKLPFSWWYDENNRNQLRVKVDIGAFCKENLIRTTLDQQWFESIWMLSKLLERRIGREDDLFEAPQEEDANLNDDPMDAEPEGEADIEIEEEVESSPSE